MSDNQPSVSYITTTETELTIFPPDETVTIETIEEYLDDTNTWSFNHNIHTAETQLPLDIDSETSRMGTIRVDAKENVIQINSFEPVDSRLLYQRVKDVFGGLYDIDSANVTSVYKCDFSHPLVSFETIRDVGNWENDSETSSVKYVDVPFTHPDIENDETCSVRLYETGDMVVFGASAIDVANEALHVLNDTFRSELPSVPDSLQVNELQSDWASILLHSYPVSVIETIVWDWDTIGTALHEDTNRALLLIDQSEWTQTTLSLCLVETMLTVLHAVSTITNEQREAFYEAYTQSDETGSIFVDVVKPEHNAEIDKESFVNNVFVTMESVTSMLQETRTMLDRVLRITQSYAEFDMTRVESGTTWRINIKQYDDPVTITLTHKDTVSEIDFPHNPVWWARITNANNDTMGKEVMFNPQSITNE